MKMAGKSFLPLALCRARHPQYLWKCNRVAWFWGLGYGAPPENRRGKRKTQGFHSSLQVAPWVLYW